MYETEEWLQSYHTQKEPGLQERHLSNQDISKQTGGEGLNAWRTWRGSLHCWHTRAKFIVPGVLKPIWLSTALLWRVYMEDSGKIGDCKVRMNMNDEPRVYVNFTISADVTCLHVLANLTPNKLSKFEIREWDPFSLQFYTDNMRYTFSLDMVKD